MIDTISPDVARRIRDVLADAGYTDDGVARVLGVDSLSRLRERKLPVLLRRTNGGTALETLIRLFILDQPVDLPTAQGALAPMTPETWAAIGLVETDEPEEFARLFDRWMAYYAERRIVSVGRGVIVMRRAGGRPNWFDVDMGPIDITFPCGDDVRQLVELRTYLHGLDGDEDLLDRRLRVASNVRFEQLSPTIAKCPVLSAAAVATPDPTIVPLGKTNVCSSRLPGS